ncbi:MAG: hypothetical protein WCI64_12015 [Chlorobium sp.]
MSIMKKEVTVAIIETSKAVGGIHRKFHLKHPEQDRLSSRHAELLQYKPEHKTQVHQ